MKNILLNLCVFSTAINVNFYCVKLWGDSPSLEVPFTQPILFPVEENKPLVAPEFIQVRKTTNAYPNNSIHDDIMSRALRPFLRADRNTNAHETTHGINADIRNSHVDPGLVNGFYVTGGRGVVIYEPKIKKSAIIPFVPKSLRLTRFELYIQGSPAWEDRPLYIFDEWVSYVNGASVSVEDSNNGMKLVGGIDWTDEVTPVIEFSVYSIAVAMAVEANDPEYWKNNIQFRNFVHWHLQRSYEVYQAGKDVKEIEDKSKVLEKLRTDPDAEAMRAFLKKNFDSVLLK